MIAYCDSQVNGKWSSLNSSLTFSKCNLKDNNVSVKSIKMKSSKKLEIYHKRSHHWWKVCWINSNTSLLYNHVKSSSVNCSPLTHTVESILSKNNSVNSTENENRCQAINDNE